MEKWRDVVGFEGVYQVSDRGRVRSLDRLIECRNGRIYKWRGQDLLTFVDRAGYVRVSLSRNDRGNSKGVHRLVAEAYIPNPEGKPHVNHVNSVPCDNRVENLEWCTPAENMTHASKAGRLNGNKGQKRARKVRCVETGDEYPSIAAASRVTKARYGGIHACCIGRQLTCGGYHWEYC